MSLDETTKVTLFLLFLVAMLAETMPFGDPMANTAVSLIVLILMVIVFGRGMVWHD